MDILRRGSRGFKVQYLQRLVNKALVRDHAGGTSLTEDGAYGPLTEGALRAFQARHRPLREDGEAGPATWGALGLAPNENIPR
jgi:peptidoglycan hydrolase-like protein with peptidoglycan-binding domain